MNVNREIKEGNVAVYTRFYKEYHPRIYAQILFLSNSPTLAEEITQETFLKLWETRESIVVNKSLKSYVRTIAHHKLMDHFREGFTWESVNEVVAEPAATQTSVIDDLIFQEYQAVAQQAVDQLPQPKRAIFQLRYQESLSYAEIAHRLGTTPKAIERHLAKATLTVKQYLAQHIDIVFLLLLLIF